MTVMLLILLGSILFFDKLFVGCFLFFCCFLFFVFNGWIISIDEMKVDLWGFMGLDSYSFYLLLLSLWLISLIYMFIGGLNGWDFNSKILYYILWLLFFFIMMMFCSLDFLSMYLFFECSIVPMFVIIMFYGIYKERYEASLYMYMYTLISSIPTFFLIVLVYLNLFTVSLDLGGYMNYECDDWVVFTIMMMFMIKVPLFFFHIWLPKAHVEAPVYGSMILASLMLKMGGYGIIRFMEVFFVELWIKDILMVISMTGSVVIGIFCLYHTDLKVIVAYSSIIHMGGMIGGFMSEFDEGFYGGYLMMIFHGICSSGLFYLVNVMYCFSGSRITMLNKGIYGIMPVLIYMWLIMLVYNLGIPPSIGILIEVYLLVSVVKFSVIFIVAIMMIIFFCSCFTIKIYVDLMKDWGGSLKVVGGGGFFLMDYFVIVIHLMPMSFMIFFSDLF